MIRFLPNSLGCIVWFFLAGQCLGLYGDSVTQLKLSALEGDSHAQVRLGFAYSKDPLKDEKEAFYWMSMAAGQGVPIAARFVGYAHLEGTGTAKSKILAQKWFAEGSRMGDSLSMIGLSDCLLAKEEKIERIGWLLLAREKSESLAKKRLESAWPKLSAAEREQAEQMVADLRKTIRETPTSPPPPRSLRKKNTLRLSNGDSYRGQIENGLPHGFGERKSPDGHIYQGSFQNGLEEGFGTLFSPRGIITYQGLWQKGNPVRRPESKGQ